MKKVEEVTSLEKMLRNFSLMIFWIFPHEEMRVGANQGGQKERRGLVLGREFAKVTLRSEGHGLQMKVVHNSRLVLAVLTAFAAMLIIFWGQENRFVDIQADAGKETGIFEDLHGYPNGADFSERLKACATMYYGTAFHEFAREVIENVDLIPVSIGERRMNP